jgi:glyceraldehyde-3-phosphate dehydrogenase/erythrose-4-phosphate dehydrogenase
MNTDQFKIAVIGAGDAGLELLNRLFTAEFIDILGVADTNDQAPGILLAKEHNIPVTTDMYDLLKDSSQIDILIDVTGVKAVRDALRTHMQESGNYHTIIMHERISALLLSLFNGEMVATKASDEFY